MRKILPILLTASLVVACQDQQPTTAPDGAPILFAISDGASGGNPDFFFYPPLADSPTGDPNFDAGEFNAFLAPFVRICELDYRLQDQDPPTTPPTVLSCVETFTDIVRPMTLDFGNEQYKFNWKTGDFPLQDSVAYRIHVYVGSEALGTLGYRDVIPLPGPPVASCSTLDDFCQFNNGSTLPIKVRIENRAFCPVGVECQTQSFDLAGGVSFNLEDQFLLNVPNQPESQQGTVTFQQCAVDNTPSLIDLPLFGPCMETVLLSGEPVELDPDFTATISFCDVDVLADYGPGSPDNLSAAQVANLRVHHFRGATGEGGVEALRVANDCPEPLPGSSASLPSNPIERLAGRILSWIGPRPLQAAAVGRGGFGGNSMETIGSKFKIALPAKIDFVDVADATRVALVGSTLQTRAIVTDLNGAAVAGATVRWNVAAVGIEGAEVTGSVAPSSADCVVGSSDDVVCTTGSSGSVEVGWMLATDPGINKLTAGGRGIADSRNGFNGPRDATYTAGPFDPFQPIGYTESGDDDIGSPDDEIFTTIAENTRLLFTAIGCEEGFGTPNAIDGTMDPGEWDCAIPQTFQVNLSGGSTVDATLYYMNDNSDFHLAVVVPGTDRQNGLRVEWDSDGDGNLGGREVGDDVWEFDPDDGPADKFIDDKCSTSSQSGCGNNDADFLITPGVGMDTEAAFDNTVGGQTVYEMSHPLSTEQVCEIFGKKGCSSAFPIDLQAAVGQTKGAVFTLRLGSGAQGNTQWPGFLDYLMIQIK
jgi:hypothetical protein